MGRLLRAGGLLLASAALVLAAATPAVATESSHTDSVHKSQYTYSVYGRTITAGNSNIYYQKTDGPQVLITWYKCGYTSVHGANVQFANPDPTGRQLIDYGFLANTTFCLRFYSQGNNTTDTVTGNTWWNVYS